MSQVSELQEAANEGIRGLGNVVEALHGLYSTQPLLEGQDEYLRNLRQLESSEDRELALLDRLQDFSRAVRAYVDCVDVILRTSQESLQRILERMEKVVSTGKK